MDLLRYIWVGGWCLALRLGRGVGGLAVEEASNSSCHPSLAATGVERYVTIFIKSSSFWREVLMYGHWYFLVNCLVHGERSNQSSTAYPLGPFRMEGQRSHPF